MMTKGIGRLRRPEQIPERLWRGWSGDAQWKKAVVAFLAEHMGEEFTCTAIRRATGLTRPILTERLSGLRRLIDRSRSTVELVWRQDGNTVLWGIQERKN